MRLSHACAAVLVGLTACISVASDPVRPVVAGQYETWATYGGNHEQNRYSSLTQINRAKDRKSVV